MVPEGVVLAAAVVAVVPALVVDIAARLVVVVIGIGLLGAPTGEEELLVTRVSEVG